MIYTSYFGNHKNFPKDSYLISIATVCVSSNMYDKDIPFLAPDINTLEDYKKGLIDEDSYTERYYDKLNHISYETKHKLIEFLHRQESMYPGGVFLLCYERPEKFCHRHLLAKWLDIGITEYLIYKKET